MSSIKDRIKDARQDLARLDLKKTIRKLRNGRKHRQARRHARRQFQHERDVKLDRIDDLIKDGVDPESERIKDLEREVKHADVRVGELHTAIGRLEERIDELVPKVTRKRKRKHHLIAKIRKLRKMARDNDNADLPSDHFTKMDGKIIPKWIARINRRARKSGRWTGVIVSGYRTPEYSEQLCIAMCGHPSCPGLCAGRLTNHACPPSNTGVRYEGAEDVTDSAGLDAHCQAAHEPLIGNGRVLPRDTVHFSHNGN